MVKRAKPRWDWEHTHDAADMNRRQARVDFDWLIEEIGCGFTPDLPTTEQSLYAIFWEFYNSEFDDNGPDWNQVGAALDEISECAATLGEKLDRLDWRSSSWLVGAFHELAKSSESHFTDAQIEKSANIFLAPSYDIGARPIVSAISVLIEAIENLDLPSEPKSRGPRPKTTIKILIAQLALLIEEQSGRDPLEGFYYDAIEERYKGRLVRILEHIFNRFAPDLNMTNSAIGGQIRRTL